MNRKTFESEALYRFKVIAPLVNEVFPRGELKQKLLELSEKWYEHPDRGWEQFAFKTIEEWYYLYKRSGLAGLERKQRSDHRQSRSISSCYRCRTQRSHPKRKVSSLPHSAIPQGDCITSARIDNA